jgi:hypothetical protein
MKKICFATWELKPFTSGGIGTLLHNILKYYSSPSSGVAYSVLWYGEPNKVDQKLFEATFSDCKIYDVSEWVKRDVLNPGTYPGRDSFRLERHAQSFAIMRALRAIEAEYGAFDVVEFPDFGGAGFASIHEKRLGRAFQNSILSVRIHSTDSVLRRYDHRPSSLDNAHLLDLERKALLDADLVIAHLEPVAASVKDAYNFDEKWLANVIVANCPVFVDQRGPRIEKVLPETPITFSSKIQWVKRPFAFVNGVVAFIDANPEYLGNVYLLAHVIDNELSDHCQQLIPEHLTKRFVFPGGSHGCDRESLISSSIAVNPSRYESYSLAAYEGSQLGAISVLNENNPAFGPGTPWKDFDNCFKYDGSAQGLTSALQALWNSRDHVTNHEVEFDVPETPYWAAPLQTRAERTTVKPAGISLIVAVNRECQDPAATFRSALLCNELNMEICLACDLSGCSPETIAFVKKLESRKNEFNFSIKIAHLRFRGGLAALFNLGLQNASYSIISFARSSTVFKKQFLKEASEALVQNPLYAFVVPQAGERDGFSEETVVRLRFGEAVNIAIYDNLIAGHEFVCTRSVAEEIGFDEELDRFIDWDFHLRAAFAGHRYIVSNRIDVYNGSERRELPLAFRTHKDTILSKHSFAVRGGRFSIVSVFDFHKEPVHPGTDLGPVHGHSARPISRRIAFRVGLEVLRLLEEISPAAYKNRIRMARGYMWHHNLESAWKALRDTSL